MQRSQTACSFSLHSLHRRWENKVAGEHRPWEVSVLWHSDRRAADAVFEYLCARESEHGYCVGNNQPYSGVLIPGYTTPTHGLARGLPHVIIEIRNDKLQQEESAAFIVDLLANAFAHAIAVCSGLPEETKRSDVGSSNDNSSKTPISSSACACPPK